MAENDRASRLIVTIESRELKHTLGPVAWAVLEDVSLDAVLQDGRWLATTSTRQVADHLGLTPGTVARALARLCGEGLVHREDRRDVRTGRFGETVYVVASMTALLPCVDPPHTVRRDTDTPNTVQPATVTSPTAPSSSEALSHLDDQRTAPVPGRRTGSPSRRRAGPAGQQLLLGEQSVTTPVPFTPSTTTTTKKAQQTNHQTPTTQNPRTQDASNSETPNPTTQRATDTCQPSGRAGPGRASC